MVARESNAQMSLHLQMVRLFNLLGQGRQTVGSVSQLFIVHNSAKLKRTHTLFEKSRARSSRCDSLTLLQVDTLNRGNLWYPSLSLQFN